MRRNVQSSDEELCKIYVIPLFSEFVVKCLLTIERFRLIFRYYSFIRSQIVIKFENKRKMSIFTYIFVSILCENFSNEFFKKRFRLFDSLWYLL